MRNFLLLLAFLSSSFYVTAQRITVGVKVGVVPTDTFTSAFGELSDESKGWTIGPSFEMELWKGLGVEVDALYRHIGFDAYRSNIIGIYVRERDRSWEFPILAKYRMLPASKIRPFAVAGYAPRTVSGSAFSEIRNYPFPGPPPDPRSRNNTSYPVTHGFVVGGGVDFKVWRLRVSPEFRYTRWNKPFFELYLQQTQEFATQNQAEILLGISFP